MTRDDIRSACTLLFSPGQTVEVRALGKRGTASGYFDNGDILADRVDTLDRSGEYAGIYVTLNPVNPALLSRRANRIETRLGTREPTTADGDITHRVWLPVDIDPVRPSGVSSSEDEHESAKITAYHIAEYLADLGWPDPVVADSGNGAHLLYRVDLPNDDESRNLVKGVLETLSTLFSDAGARVDTGNHNAGRIWKLYGTTCRKGDNTKDRPHRRAGIISVPETIEIVSRETLAHLASMFPKMESLKPGAKDRKLGEIIDLAGWLRSYGIGYQQKPYASGDLFVLDECPFSSDHKDGAYCIQFSSGAIFAGCHHTSCGAGMQRWSELRERYEGTISQRMKTLKMSRRDGDAIPDLLSPAPARGGDLTAIPDEAYRVIHEGDPLRYMLDTFALDHIGDPAVAECLVMSLASRLVMNAKGLHVSVTGESGKGKSHAFDTMMQQVPDDLRLEGRMSDKALFYIKGMKPGTVIALDDVSLSDQMQEVLKGVTTSFKKPFKYRTVNKDRGGETCIIPERCVWWVAKVDGTGDDQVWNRMLTCWIDDSEEQDAKVLAEMLREASAVPAGEPGIRTEVAVCQEIWQSLGQVHVIVPIAEHIRFSSSMNRRNPDMMLDLVKCHAALMQHQRDRTDTGTMVCITATGDDFKQACRLFLALNGKSGGQQSKLTRKESALVDAIRSRGQGEITISELQHLTGWSYSVMYKMLHGSCSHGYQYSGLLEKCPALSVCDRTLVTDEGGMNAAHRRVKAYAWDPYVYEVWRSDGGCWLDGHGPDDDGDDDPPGGFAEDDGKNANNSATKPGKNSGSDQEYLSNNNLFSTRDGKSEYMKQGICDNSGTGDHICDPEFSADPDPNTQSGHAVPSVSGSEDAALDPGIRNFSAAGSDLPQGGNISVQSGSSVQPVIRSAEFIRVKKRSDTGSCDCCGYHRVMYQERMRTDRPPRKICKRCYESAKKAESSGIRPIPGLLNSAGMVRTSVDLGRCQVCNGGKAVWRDKEAGVSICERSYQTNAGECRRIDTDV